MLECIDRFHSESQMRSSVIKEVPDMFGAVQSKSLLSKSEKELLVSVPNLTPFSKELLKEISRLRGHLMAADNEFHNGSFLKKRRARRLSKEPLKPSQLWIKMTEEILVAECTLCATYYKTFRKLRRHFKKRHADLEVFQCYFCDYMTHDKIMFKQHKEYLHADKKFVCKKCHFKTRKWTRMERHFDKHKTTKPVIELPLSEDLSSTSRVKEAVQEIIQKQTIEKNLFSCNICDKYFQSKIKLKEHVKIHSLEHPLKCTLGKDKRKTQSINEICSPEHLNLSFTMNEPDHYTSKVKETVQELIDVFLKKKEMEEKRFVCEICKKRFQYKSDLLKHSKVHTQERPYKCTLCDYAGKWKSSLTIHMNFHSDERPFKCTFCEYKAKKAIHLNCHIKIHLNKRDFACEICDYKSFTKQLLQRHLRVHTGEKPFKCHFCERAFSQNTTLKHHQKGIHQVLSNMNPSNAQQQKVQS